MEQLLKEFNEFVANIHFVYGCDRYYQQGDLLARYQEFVRPTKKVTTAGGFLIEDSYPDVDRCYIAGKIGDLSEDEYKRLFIDAKNEVAAKGMVPVSPVDLPHNHDKSWNAYMREDIQALMTCKHVYVLKNWVKSPGARIEVGLALQLGLNIIYQA